MGHSPHARGYRDGFWARPRWEKSPEYLSGYTAGQKASDRTQTRPVAGSAENASSALSGLAPEPSCLTAEGEAASSPPETPEAQ